MLARGQRTQNTKGQQKRIFSVVICCRISTNVRPTQRIHVFHDGIARKCIAELLEAHIFCFGVSLLSSAAHPMASSNFESPSPLAQNFLLVLYEVVVYIFYVIPSFYKILPITQTAIEQGIGYISLGINSEDAS